MASSPIQLQLIVSEASHASSFTGQPGIFHPARLHSALRLAHLYDTTRSLSGVRVDTLPTTLLKSRTTKMQNLNAASLAVAATALLAALPGAQAGLYSKNSPVIQVSAKTYDQLIAKSNHTAVSLSTLCGIWVTATDSKTRSSSSTLPGAATARICSLPMKRLPSTWMALQRSPPSTVMKTRTRPSAGPWASRASPP